MNILSALHVCYHWQHVVKCYGIGMKFGIINQIKKFQIF